MSVQTIGEGSFQINHPQLFNELPGELRDMTKCEVDEFKAKLDEFLQMIPDQPKCSGLTPVAQKPDATQSNSLLYQVFHNKSVMSSGVFHNEFIKFYKWVIVRNLDENYCIPHISTFQC